MSSQEKIVVQELIETMDGYITLLGEAESRNLSFLSVHGIHTPESDIKQGKVFREKISLLKMELKQFGD